MIQFFVYSCVKYLSYSLNGNTKTVHLGERGKWRKSFPSVIQGPRIHNRSDERWEKSRAIMPKERMTAFTCQDRRFPRTSFKTFKTMSCLVELFHPRIREFQLNYVQFNFSNGQHSFRCLRPIRIQLYGFGYAKKGPRLTVWFTWTMKIYHTIILCEPIHLCVHKVVILNR